MVAERFRAALRERPATTIQRTAMNQMLRNAGVVIACLLMILGLMSVVLTVTD